MPEPQREQTTYVVASGDVQMNEHQLIRVLERMDGRRRRGPDVSWWLGTGGICLALIASVATADFHPVHGISKDDIHTVAVVLIVLFAVATIVLLGWWLLRLPANLKRETPEQIVAEVKREAAVDDAKLRRAEKDVAPSSPVATVTALAGRTGPPIPIPPLAVREERNGLNLFLQVTNLDTDSHGFHLEALALHRPPVGATAKMPWPMLWSDGTCSVLPLKPHETAVVSLGYWSDAGAGAVLTLKSALGDMAMGNTDITVHVRVHFDADHQDYAVRLPGQPPYLPDLGPGLVTLWDER